MLRIFALKLSYPFNGNSAQFCKVALVLVPIYTAHYLFVFRNYIYYIYTNTCHLYLIPIYTIKCRFYRWDRENIFSCAHIVTLQIQLVVGKGTYGYKKKFFLYRSLNKPSQVIILPLLYIFSFGFILHTHIHTHDMYLCRFYLENFRVDTQDLTQFRIDSNKKNVIIFLL